MRAEPHCEFVMRRRRCGRNQVGTLLWLTQDTPNLITLAAEKAAALMPAWVSGCLLTPSSPGHHGCISCREVGFRGSKDALPVRQHRPSCSGHSRLVARGCKHTMPHVSTKQRPNLSQGNCERVLNDMAPERYKCLDMEALVSHLETRLLRSTITDLGSVEND